MSLVAAYSDSESEDDGESVVAACDPVKVEAQPTRTLGNACASATHTISSDDDDCQEEIGGDNIRRQDNSPYRQSTGPSTTFLFSSHADEEDDGESSDDDDMATKSEEETSNETKNKIPLANPFRECLGRSTEEKHESVFEIPFLDQEKEKSAALERHVKMTQAAGTQEMINGKKICWNYRKGRCRFGHNCTFAHDSDIQQTQEKKIISTPVTPVENSTAYFSLINSKAGAGNTSYDESAVVVASPHLGHSKAPAVKSAVVDDSDEDNNPSERNEGGIGKKGKKRRPGLSQSLTPGKKVMKIYYQQHGSNPS